MNISDFNTLVVQRGAMFLPPDLNTLESRVQLAATAGVETNWSARVQVPNGQARGYFQCEKHGGVMGVFGDPVAGGLLRKTCFQFDIPFLVEAVYDAIAYHDVLAYVLARLIYTMDPAALPAAGDSAGSWNCYVHNWRPGKPGRDRWNAVYATVIANVH